MEPITVLILSWNRPIFLWACLDSLYRYTRRPARFVLVDNNSDDPMVRSVISGFERRRMFHQVEWAKENLPSRPFDMIHKYRALFGKYFVYIESDTVVFDTEPCWLSRLHELMDANPEVAVLGSYLDTRDFIDPEFARQSSPEMDIRQLHGLIKAHAPGRSLGPTPTQTIIDPFNPPGRLLMLRTSIIDLIPQDVTDSILQAQVKAAGFTTGIATGVSHRHLSLLNFFDYPEYDMTQRDNWMYGQNAATAQP